nr:MAG TPA: hypothetical protein [Caudoviricetes sp.]
MKFKFLGVFKRVFNWLQNRVLTTRKPPQNRPHFYSKNAWSYAVKGKPTPAEIIMWRLCR